MFRTEDFVDDGGFRERKRRPKSNPTNTNTAFPDWSSGLADMMPKDKEFQESLKNIPWKEMGLGDFSPLRAMENMNSDEYKKIKARLEAMREREAEEKDVNRPMEDEPGAFALMLETTLDFFFLTPTLFVKSDGSFMFEPRKKDVAKMAVILQSMEKGGGDNKSELNASGTNGVGLGMGRPVKDFKPTLMFMPNMPATHDGLLQHDDRSLIDRDNPYIPSSSYDPTAVDPATRQLLIHQPQPQESTEPRFRNKFKPHIPIGHKYIPKEEYSYDDAFSLCPIMTISIGDDVGTQCRIKLPGISVPLHVSGLPRICAGNMLFCLQRLYRMFGCRLPGGMQWNNMCLRADGHSKPLDHLDDLIPDVDDQDDLVRDADGNIDPSRTTVGLVIDGELTTPAAAEIDLNLGGDDSVNVDVSSVPTFILEPHLATITIFVPNAPVPLIFGRTPEPKTRRNERIDIDKASEEDVDAFYNDMLKNQEQLPSDWQTQLRNYVPKRGVRKVVLDDFPKNMTLRDFKVAIASSAYLELSPNEACCVDLYREYRYETSEVSVEPEEGEDDHIEAVRRQLLQMAQRHKRLEAIQHHSQKPKSKKNKNSSEEAEVEDEAQEEGEEEVDLRSLPASALAQSDICTFKWELIDYHDDTPMWKLNLDSRGSEYNVFEFQFDLKRLAVKRAQQINNGDDLNELNNKREAGDVYSFLRAADSKTQEVRSPITLMSMRHEYGVGAVSVSTITKAIDEKQRLKMQQVSYQRARDAGLLTKFLAEREYDSKKEGWFSTKMLIIYMVVYIVAVAMWWVSNSKKDVHNLATQKGSKFGDKMTEKLKNIPNMAGLKTPKFDL